jgi:hypothetical protein
MIHNAIDENYKQKVAKAPDSHAGRPERSRNARQTAATDEVAKDMVVLDRPP